MYVLTPSLLRLVALSLCAAVLLLEHVRLALRAREQGSGWLGASLLVPFVGAALAWRQGGRVGPVVYMSLFVTYLALFFWP